jgi:hypothetical protein
MRKTREQTTAAAVSSQLVSIPSITRSTLEEKPETERVAKVRVGFREREVKDRFTRREAREDLPREGTIERSKRDLKREIDGAGRIDAAISGLE